MLNVRCTQIYTHVLGRGIHVLLSCMFDVLTAHACVHHHAVAGCRHAHGNSAEQNNQPDDLRAFDSLAASLVGESTLVDRINHEHVIPFSELTLKELIGSGAEGKVRLALRIA